jgi:hypothetical protein
VRYAIVNRPSRPNSDSTEVSLTSSFVHEPLEGSQEARKIDRSVTSKVDQSISLVACDCKADVRSTDISDYPWAHHLGWLLSSGLLSVVFIGAFDPP